MPPVKVKDNAVNNFPCKNCKAPNDQLYTCPTCNREFCSNCFIEIPEGNGVDIRCPNPECNAVLQLPMPA